MARSTTEVRRIHASTHEALRAATLDLTSRGFGGVSAVRNGDEWVLSARVLPGDAADREFGGSIAAERTAVGDALRARDDEQQLNADGYAHIDDCASDALGVSTRPDYWRNSRWARRTFTTRREALGWARDRGTAYKLELEPSGEAPTPWTGEGRWHGRRDAEGRCERGRTTEQFADWTGVWFVISWERGDSELLSEAAWFARYGAGAQSPIAWSYVIHSRMA